MSDTIKETFFEELQSVEGLATLESLRVKYLGKKGVITEAVKKLSSLPIEQRPQAGKELNETKQAIEESLGKKEKHLRDKQLSERLAKEYLDITVPGRYIPRGRLHPINQVLAEINHIFSKMGFDVEEGPEVELDYYNFEALNIPKEHPARDMQDTFYISDEVVLRTQTSPVQIRVMEKKAPPLRFISPGKVYRCDSDVSHTPMFHQVEGLMVDKNISFSHLKGILETFLKEMYGSSVEVRFRPSFFPFTEPSAEIDISCIMCGSKGCRVCKETGWLEVLGAGMVHPKVFENVGYNPEEFTGFAFGMGVERLTMLRYSITDIRLFFDNDLRFLRQF